MGIRYYLGKFRRQSINKIQFYKRLLYNKRMRISQYPTVIQLPITYLCNFDCVMCGMHHMIGRKDFTPDEIRKILQDELFTRIEYVGVNGGEPFLRKDIT